MTFKKLITINPTQIKRVSTVVE